MSNIKLYEEQQRTVNIINSKLENDPICDRFVYLSGEMGVGKTYMGVEIVNNYKSRYDKRTIFIVVPSIVRKKWHSLLGDDTTVLKKTHTDLSSSDKGVYLINMEDLNVWQQKIKQAQSTFFEQDMLFLVDEVHLCKNTKFDAFQTVLRQLTKQSHGVFLTGTIREGQSYDIATLLNRTHPTHIRNLLGRDGHIDELSDMIVNRFSNFVFSIWQYISVSLALEDIKSMSSSSNEERQELRPIEHLPLNIENQLLNNMIEASLNHYTSSERARYLSTAFLDNPERPLIYKTTQRNSQTRLRSGSIVDIGLPLLDVKVSNTDKFKALVKLINDNPDDKVLVYMNDSDLMERVKHALSDEDIQAFTLDKKLSKDNYSEHINEQFECHTVGIVDPSKVNVGVDIHAEQLVWYQLMPKIDKMIQAQRRVCRLSSQYKSYVTLLVYDTDFDKNQTRELSEAVKMNAATYGVKQQDKLAALTGIILDGVK